MRLAARASIILCLNRLEVELIRCRFGRLDVDRLRKLGRRFRPTTVRFRPRTRLRVAIARLSFLDPRARRCPCVILLLYLGGMAHRYRSGT